MSFFHIFFWSLTVGFFVDDPDDLISWKKFSQVRRHTDGYTILTTLVCLCHHVESFFSLCEQKDNHWIWIDGILDLIKKHLVDIWRDG